MSDIGTAQQAGLKKNNSFSDTFSNIPFSFLFASPPLPSGPSLYSLTGCGCNPLLFCACHGSWPAASSLRGFLYCGSRALAYSAHSPPHARTPLFGDPSLCVACVEVTPPSIWKRGGAGARCARRLQKPLQINRKSMESRSGATHSQCFRKRNLEAKTTIASPTPAALGG